MVLDQRTLGDLKMCEVHDVFIILGSVFIHSCHECAVWFSISHMICDAVIELNREANMKCQLFSNTVRH